LKGSDELKRKIIILTVILSIIFVMSAYADSYSWYFKPNNNNVQPELIPEAKSFMDKYDTIYMGSPDEKKIYLTFDAGYENGNVAKIVDILKEKNAPGAFFILPQLAKTSPDLLKRMKEDGHLICNHTSSHRDMSKVVDFETFAAELKEAENILLEITGIEMDKFYRPPEGRFSEKNLEFADKLGYKTVFWSLAYADWDNNNQMNPGRALNLVNSRTHNGCVALFHPTSATNAAILGDYIDAMRNKGYEFCSLNDFVSQPTGGESNEE
jgi:peptidoglycan-N-acetylmuramic acid deacetylase